MSSERGEHVDGLLGVNLCKWRGRFVDDGGNHRGFFDEIALDHRKCETNVGRFQRKVDVGKWQCDLRLGLLRHLVVGNVDESQREPRVEDRRSFENQWRFYFGLRRGLGDRFIFDGRFGCLDRRLGGSSFDRFRRNEDRKFIIGRLFQRCLFRLDGFAFFRLNRLRLVDRLSDGGINRFRWDVGGEIFGGRCLVRSLDFFDRVDGFNRFRLRDRFRFLFELRFDLGFRPLSNSLFDRRFLLCCFLRGLFFGGLFFLCFRFCRCFFGFLYGFIRRFVFAGGRFLFGWFGFDGAGWSEAFVGFFGEGIEIDGVEEVLEFLLVVVEEAPNFGDILLVFDDEFVEEDDESQFSFTIDADAAGIAAGTQLLEILLPAAQRLLVESCQFTDVADTPEEPLKTAFEHGSPRPLVGDIPPDNAVSERASRPLLGLWFAHHERGDRVLGTLPLEKHRVNVLRDRHFDAIFPRKGYRRARRLDSFGDSHHLAQDVIESATAADFLADVMVPALASGAGQYEIAHSG